MKIKMLRNLIQRFPFKIIHTEAIKLRSLYTGRSFTSKKEDCEKKETKKEKSEQRKICIKPGQGELVCDEKLTGKKDKMEVNICKTPIELPLEEGGTCGKNVCSDDLKKELTKETEKEKPKTVDTKKEEKPKPEEVLEDLLIEPLVTGGNNNYRIVIVGAGLAGLSAAKYLQDNDIQNYVILEALNRPGGRVHSEWFSDSVVELGSRCQTLTNDANVFLQKAMVDGLIKPPLSCLSLFSSSDGHTISPSTSLIAFDMFKKMYSESQEVGSETLDYINFRMEQEIRDFPKSIQEDVARIMLGLLAFKYRKEGDNLEQFITRDKSMSYLQSPGSSIKVPLGLSGLLSPMLVSIPQENIKYGKPVQCIRWGAVVCKDAPRALVKCHDGTVYPADFVIITVSLGVLKTDYDSLFCPPLPIDKLISINKLDYLHCNNIFVCFNEPIWSWTSEKINYTFTKEDASDFGSWMTGIRCISQVHRSNDVFCISVNGEEAKAVEKIDDCTVVENLLNLIKCQLPIKYEPTVKRILRSRWSNNIYFNGAYSNQPHGVADSAVQQLGSPLPGPNAPVNPILFFAGEATCPKHFATFQGAKISGIREAARVKRIITSFGTDEMGNKRLILCN